MISCLTTTIEWHPTSVCIILFAEAEMEGMKEAYEQKIVQLQNKVKSQSMVLSRLQRQSMKMAASQHYTWLMRLLSFIAMYGRMLFFIFTLVFI